MIPNDLRMGRSGDGWWLSWRRAEGLWQWIPMSLQDGVMAPWNSLVCLFRGHRLVGDLSIGICSHCYHCCKETVVPCEACAYLRKD